MKQPHELTITIRKLEDLFIDRIEENPLLPEWEADAGIQRVANYLKTRRLGRGVRVIVRVPDTLEITPVMRERLDAAIQRYCDSRIRENQVERRFTILTGLVGLTYSIMVSVLISLSASWLLTQLPLAPWLYNGLSGIFVITAWAILWGPLEAIFYDWLPNFATIRVFRTIQRGEFIIEQVKMSEPGPVF